jgi:ketosteroid isomerase-like protein
MIRTIAILLLAGAALRLPTAHAQDEATGDEAAHAELRAMREALTAAVEQGDVEAQLKYVHPNVVATWQNSRVVRGVDGLRAFLDEINAGNAKVFQGYSVPPEADELTILYGGDTGIVFGRSVPRYHYLGMDFELENRWTATLVKDEGGWKIAAYHVSGNLVDNPLLSAATKSTTYIGGGCLIAGIVAGWLLSKLSRRGRTTTEGA